MITLLAYASSLYGTPYIWSGNNELQGFDCSGLVMELLRSTGEQLPYKDMNSQMLFDFYQNGNGSWNTMKVGSLVFYGKSVTQINHVAMVVDPRGVGRIIEAGGGGKHVTSKEMAILQGALVRQRPLNYRKDLVAVIRPYYRGIGEL